jgi:hypothetical protein
MMEMDKFNTDIWNLKDFKEYFEQGNLNLEPDYQRSRVWSDDQRYGLIDSLMQSFPIGLVMLNVIPIVEDDVAVNKYDVVDGQQRIRTVLEYMLGSEEWAKLTKREDFQPFSSLKAALQRKIYGYKVPIALMTKFEDDEITEIFNRLQEGKALKPGEKLKAITASKAYPFIKDLAQHKIFAERQQNRDAHWMLAAAFFKAAYSKEMFSRIEYQNLQKFMKESILDDAQAERARTQVWKTLNFTEKVIREAKELWPVFVRFEQTARTLKWLFIVLSMLLDEYGISGKEPAVAEGVVDYYKAISVEKSSEWTEYLNTGRTGRVDTEEVRACIAEIKNRILNATAADPKDPERNFTKSQREEIFRQGKGKCAVCGTKLSKTNFHADHVRPHSKGGRTEVSNGRALCNACNTSLGNSWRDEFGLKLIPKNVSAVMSGNWRTP